MIEFLGILPLVLIVAFIALALLYEARAFDKPRYWKLRMTLATVAAVVGSIAITGLWGLALGDFHLLDGSSLGTWFGAVAGIVAYEFVHYWYHRSVHRFDWMWRAAHQMHHSAEVMDAFSANYLHPIDLVMFTTWSSLVFFPVLGLTIEAGLIAGGWVAFNTMFQHANIRTPRWLGFIVQRPESHVVHHERGRHRYNYANLPLWDMVFGTFRNPASVDGKQAGFYLGASERIVDMLLFRDVSTAPVEHAVVEDCAIRKDRAA
ncbi:MAG: sterol desaturase family protein [Pseudomonadaceae bacterium]|nr:sterol desaturase family protein [Pseudomonadaceae bacterium]